MSRQQIYDEFSKMSQKHVFYYVGRSLEEFIDNELSSASGKLNNDSLNEAARKINLVDYSDEFNHYSINNFVLITEVIGLLGRKQSIFLDGTIPLDLFDLKFKEFKRLVLLNIGINDHYIPTFDLVQLLQSSDEQKKLIKLTQDSNIPKSMLLPAIFNRVIHHHRHNGFLDSKLFLKYQLLEILFFANHPDRYTHDQKLFILNYITNLNNAGSENINNFFQALLNGYNEFKKSIVVGINYNSVVVSSAVQSAGGGGASAQSAGGGACADSAVLTTPNFSVTKMKIKGIEFLTKLNEFFGEKLIQKGRLSEEEFDIANLAKALKTMLESCDQRSPLEQEKIKKIYYFMYLEKLLQINEIVIKLGSTVSDLTRVVITPAFKKQLLQENIQTPEEVKRELELALKNFVNIVSEESEQNIIKEIKAEIVRNADYSVILTQRFFAQPTFSDDDNLPPIVGDSTPPPTPLGKK